MDSPDLCCEEGCLRPKAGHRPRCWAHYKRKQRGAESSKPVREYGQSPWEHIVRDATDLRDCSDSDDDWERTIWRLKKTIERAIGKRKRRKRLKTMSTKRPTLPESSA